MITKITFIFYDVSEKSFIKREEMWEAIKFEQDSVLNGEKEYNLKIIFEGTSKWMLGEHGLGRLGFRRGIARNKERTYIQKIISKIPRN